MSDSMRVATAWALWGFLAIGVLGWTLSIVMEYVGFPGDPKADTAPWVAILISLFALTATFWQAHLSRVHNKLSVRPHLAGHSSYTDEGIYKFELRNVGLGPAIITGARVYRSGIFVEGEGPPLIIKVFQGIPDCELLGHEFFYLDYVLPAGDSVEICCVKYNKDISDFDTFLAGHVTLELDYKSAYEELFPMFSTRKA
ncbi:hypothetical protein [Pseudomonas sp. Leaf58]|uniref:hypothetical protein n=1 Tax=Pseudomonas sp. Leaf58 TaxID=1736226 RepID=UPI0012E6F0BD|nr:hypothetical protein [Pseudomonas sp. Leaf58]